MLTRRSFLRLLGVGGAAAAVAPAVLVPERKIWQVPANAPVPRLVELPTVDPSMKAYLDMLQRRMDALSGLNICVRGGAQSPGKVNAMLRGREAEYFAIDEARSLREMWREAFDASDDTAPPLREAFANEGLDRSGELFGIEADAYPEWKGVRYSASPQSAREAMERWAERERVIARSFDAHREQMGNEILCQLHEVHDDIARNLRDFGRHVLVVGDAEDS